MSEEEKKAIERFSKAFEYLNVWNKELIVVPEDKKYFLIVLNLLEKKDKIIDLMIKVMIDSSICDYFIKQNCKHYAGENKKLCDVCIKEYFEKKEGENNDKKSR